MILDIILQWNVRSDLYIFRAAVKRGKGYRTLKENFYRHRRSLTYFSASGQTSPVEPKHSLFFTRL